MYEPYFLIAAKVRRYKPNPGESSKIVSKMQVLTISRRWQLGFEAEVEEWLRRKFEGVLKKTTRLTKEDLQMPNHLLGYRRTFIKLEFDNVSELLNVRKVLMPIAEKNKKNVKAMDAYAEVARFVSSTLPPLLHNPLTVIQVQVPASTSLTIVPTADLQHK